MVRWLRQPTSVAGLSAVFGTFAALVMNQVTWAQAVPLLAGAVMSIALPDNAGARSSAEAVARDLVTDFSKKQEKN